MIDYKIPDDILAKIPEHFWAAFVGELVSVFSPSVFEKNIDSETIMLNMITGTGGWHAALKMTCRKLGMDWLYIYYNDLPWYDSDMFDSEIEDLIFSKFIDLEDVGMNDYYKWLIELDKDSIEREIGEYTVAYICDQKQCENCSAEHGFCEHTTDIRHATNFEEVTPGKWMEE